MYSSNDVSQPLLVSPFNPHKIEISELTLQTTVPHLRHSPTRSLAQLPTLPIISIPALPCSTKYKSAALARYRKVCSGFGSTSSFAQCSVHVKRYERYWSRLARIWRQVIDRESKVLRSRCAAMEVMILKLFKRQ